MPKSKCDFLLVAALPKEFHPKVRDLFRARPLPKGPRDTRSYYEATLDLGKGQHYALRLLCVGRKGASRASAALVDAVTRCRPRQVIMFGIAAVNPGGNRKKGSILVADDIVSIEEIKKARSDFPRPLPYPCEDELVDHLQEHFGSLIEGGKLHVGPMISQPNLSRKAEYRNQLVRHVEEFLNREVIGLEMEGSGLAIAIRTRPREGRPGVLLVKGGVDWGNYHKDDRLQKSVAFATGEFVRTFLLSRPISAGRRRVTRSPESSRALPNKVASRDLKAAPREAIAAAGLTAFYSSRRDYARYRNHASSIDSYVDSARRSIVMVSVNLMTGLPFDGLCAVLKKKLESSGGEMTVSISLLDPRKRWLMRAMAPILDVAPEKLARDIRETLNQLVAFRRQLSGSAQERFKVRAHSAIPFGSAIMIDHREPWGRIQIETKPYKAPVRRSFAFELGPTRSDGLFAAIAEGFETLMKDGNPWP